jgi:hypothetical protein
MTGKAALLPILLLALALGAGCTFTQGGGGIATPTMTPVTTTPPAPGVTVPPGPVVTVPAIYDVQIQVNRNPNSQSPTITVAFRGGSGQLYLQDITVTVARSDGMVIQETIPMSTGTQYAVGDSVTIMGTTGTDEVVVMVTVNGVEYKIYDELLTFGASP